jgi:hypothetical protein
MEAFNLVIRNSCASSLREGIATHTAGYPAGMHADPDCKFAALRHQDVEPDYRGGFPPMASLACE